MVKYTIRRLIQAIPTMLGITILSFLLMAASPGGPVQTLAFGPKVTPQQRRALAARLGVNDPLPVQYIRWLLGDDWMRVDTNGDGIADKAALIPLDADGDGIAEPPGTNRGILRGDFGRSFYGAHTPAFDLIMQRAPATLELGISALI